MSTETTGTTETTEYRIAGAPISWGVREVPGWGYQLGPDKVLTEMREVGLLATELGPDGFLPAERTGDLDVAAIVAHLTKRGYDGWYTLEQDTILTDESTGEGPVSDVRISADNLRAVLRSIR